MVAVAGQVTNECLQVGNQFRIIRPSMLASVAPVCRAFASGAQMGVRYAKAITDQFHWSSPGNKGERTIHFRERATSMTSLRISACMVFLPSRRCSSRICFIASANAEAVTTASPTLTADRLPSW